MSKAAAWSYTATATLWPRLDRDDWQGTVTYGPPLTFACDYKAEAARMTDARGVEFVARQTIYTERADIRQGDMVLIGEHLEADPIAAGAAEVRLVGRDADTFDQVADDVRVVT